MIPVIARMVANLASVAINCIAITVTFPTRYRGRVVFGLFALFTAFLTVAFYGTGGVSIPFGGVLGSYGGVYGLLYLPMIIWLYKGLFFQKIFVVVSQLLISVAQSYLVMAIIKIFIPYGSDTYFLVLFVAISVVYAIYAGVMLKFGWSFMERLFAFGRQSDWALYTFGAMFSYAALMLLHEMNIGTALYIFLLIFIVWGFAVMCYAIINTQEKATQRYETELARSIISSGRDHYQKMNEMHDTLRVMRHDYKFHLNSARQMLRSGNREEAEQYLSGVEMQLSENELPGFCANAAINALLVSYAERCARLDIEYDVRAILPEPLTIPNYDMCIVLGNLLENAVEACLKREAGRMIELSVNSRNSQLAIVVKNRFDGKLAQNGVRPAGGGLPVSGKKDGGLGLKSVQAVAARYDGELITDWDGDVFTAYVLMKI